MPWRARGGTDAWVVSLRDPDPGVRAGAAWRLGAFGTSSLLVTQALRDAIARESDPSVQMACVSALASYRFPDAGSRLWDLALHPRSALEHRAVSAAVWRALGYDLTQDPHHRESMLERAAANATGIPGGPDSLAAALALTDALDDPESATLRVVQARFASGRAPGVLIGMCRSLALRGDPRAARILLDLLANRRGRPAGPVEVAALDALGALRALEATEVVRGFASAEDLTVRAAAVRALGRLAGTGNLDLLLAAAVVPTLRHDAWEALALSGDARALPVLRDALTLPWEGDRARASEALALLGDRAAVPWLAARARRDDAPAAQAAAWRAVAALGGPEAREALAANLDSPWALVAATELGLRDRTFRANVPPGEGASRLAALVLGDGPSREPSPEVPETTRCAEAWGSALRGSPVAPSWWRRERHEGARAGLALALARAGDPEGTLAATLRAAEGDLSTAEVIALDALASRGEPGVAPVARTLLRSGDPWRRSVGAAALAALGDRGSGLAVQVALAREIDPTARGVLARAVGSLGGRGASEALEVARRMAWTVELRDAVELGLQHLAGRPWPRPFAGTSIARVEGAPPGSVWAALLPDGRWAYGAALENGVALIPGVARADTTLRRVDEGSTSALPAP